MSDEGLEMMQQELMDLGVGSSSTPRLPPETSSP